MENVKGFRALDFDFERPDNTFAGWTVFVGGNASGKSTLLKALALSLIGPDVGRQLIVSPSGWIAPGETKAEATSKIKWDQSYDSFKTAGQSPGVTFDAGVRWAIKADDTKKENWDSVMPDFRGVEKRNAKQGRILTPTRGPWNPNAGGWFSAGYGPMRRLSGSSSESIRLSVGAGAMSRFVTLFREDAALSESETWLRLNHSRQIESKNASLANLLSGVSRLLDDGLLPHGMKISRITVDHVYVRDGRGVELPMRDISDGCRSVYATVLDLVHGMAEVYGTTDLFGENEFGHPVVTNDLPPIPVPI
jgi:energy-coupling factor transporter ATP-binding protein EcfA2